jgi:hypothetical protein
VAAPPIDAGGVAGWAASGRLMPTLPTNNSIDKKRCRRQATWNRLHCMDIPWIKTTIEQKLIERKPIERKPIERKTDGK